METSADSLRNKIIIGIDPGKSGGVAVVRYSDKPPFNIKLYNCPDSPKDMAYIISSAKVKKKEIIAIVEHVWSFPTDARSAAFKFGTNYGMWLGILGALGITYELVAPQRWMKMYAPLPKNKQERKKKLKEIAKKIDDKATLKTCDALLIANYKIGGSKNEEEKN